MLSVQGLHVVPRDELIIRQALQDCRCLLSLRGLHLQVVHPSVAQTNLLDNLTELDLSFNSLEDLPESLKNAKRLQTLLAHHNSLQRLPACIGKLRQLKKLDVSHNKITCIPSDLTYLELLESVNFSGNCISILEAATFRSTRLRTFFVTRNPIENVPSDVYVYGLRAIRHYFGINQTISQLPVEQDNETSCLRSLLAQVKLRPVPIEENSKERSNCDRFDQRINRQPLQEVEVAAVLPKQVLELVVHERQGSTSDYGSCSSSNVDSDHLRDALNAGDNFSCHGDCGSDNGDLDVSEIDDRCEVCLQPLYPEIDFEEEFIDCILPNRSRLLKQAQVAVIIPEHNKQNFMRSEFYLNVVEDLSFVPELGDDAVQASPVISLGPHGAQFYEDCPAVIRLPLFVNINYTEQVQCFRSNTCDTIERPFWERIPACDFRVRDGYVLIRTKHFSLFNAILDASPPEVSQHISAEKGGTVKVDQIEGVEVNFPIGSLKQDIIASVKVLCSDLPPELRTNLDCEDALASPTLILKPHGYFFNENVPVLVKLPIPDYSKIVQRFGTHATLTVWHSETTDDEPVQWENHSLESKLDCDEHGNYFIIVPMVHFSWLTSLWNSIKGQMSGAGMGMGTFYSGGAVSMKCQAWMLDKENSNKFGLVIICHRSESSMQDVGNYGKNVGGSLKPVCISPGGDILIKLAKSEYFDADTAAGEDPSLEKTEANYRGGEFDVQFACKFKQQQPTNKDIFGKVFVKRLIDGREEKLFEFNLIQKNDEPDNSCEDPWMAASLRELAEMHGIMTDDNWKKFARALHFSPADIRNRFSRAQDPFGVIISQYRNRGGSHEDFLQTLNQVGRELRLGDEAGQTPATPAPASTAGGWKEMLGFGWFGGGGRTTAPATVTQPFCDENIPGPSGFQSSNSRKRVCPTCEASEPATPKRLRLHTSLASSPHSSLASSPHGSLSSSQQLFGQLQISTTSIPPTPQIPCCTPPRTPPHNPGVSYGSLHAFNRHSPPLCSTTQRHTNVSMVHSHMGSVMSSAASGGPRFSNTPFTESQYGSIPTTSQQNLPGPSNASANLEDHMMRRDSMEITQRQLYRIAPLIQTQWIKVARYIWDNEAAESDIKEIKEGWGSPEEQAVQMLLQWREKCPDACVRGRLYSALCDLNLKTIAKKCGQIYENC